MSAAERAAWRTNFESAARPKSRLSHNPFAADRQHSASRMAEAEAKFGRFVESEGRRELVLHLREAGREAGEVVAVRSKLYYFNAYWSVRRLVPFPTHLCGNFNLNNQRQAGLSHHFVLSCLVLLLAYQCIRSVQNN